MQSECHLFPQKSHHSNITWLKIFLKKTFQDNFLSTSYKKLFFFLIVLFQNPSKTPAKSKKKKVIFEITYFLCFLHLENNIYRLTKIQKQNWCCKFLGDVFKKLFKNEMIETNKIRLFLGLIRLISVLLKPEPCNHLPVSPSTC